MWGKHYNRAEERRQQKYLKEQQEQREQDKRNILRELSLPEEGDLTNCPHCGSTSITKYKNEDRYKCNGCFRSVSVTEGTLAHKSYLDRETQLKIQEAFKKGKSIREAAEIVGVNKNTIHHWYNKFKEAEEKKEELLKEDSIKHGSSNAYANHALYKNDVDNEQTSKLITNGEINSDHYVDKKGRVRDQFNRIVDTI